MFSPVFNRYKTLFSILDTLDIVEPETKDVTLYVNLECILKVLFTGEMNNKVMACQDDNSVKISMVANIINFAQHYRWYFCKKGYNCNVYMYMNYQCNKYKNSKYIEGYREYYNNKIFNSATCMYLSNTLGSIYKTLRLILKYMNGIYLLDSNDVESSLIPYIVDKEIGNNSSTKIIVSNDKYDLQYVNYGFRILVPRQQKTVIVDRNNVISHLKTMTSVKSTEDVPYQYTTFILSLLGCKYRNIMKINGLGMGTLIKCIRDGMDKLIISTESTDMESLISILKKDYRDRFEKNYLCTNVEYQYRELTPVDIHNIISQIEDKYDENTLDYINDRYFQMCPIFSIKTHKEQLYSGYNTKNIFDR